jgi:tripartite-type tricarboxylate transporter receptor subunit TctC
MKEQFARNGAEPLTNTPAEFFSLIRAEIDQYTKVSKAACSKLE